MPNHIVPSDPFTATIRTIPCPDCKDGFELGSLRQPEACPTCAGYRTILHPEEVERTKADYQKMRDTAAYDLKGRTLEPNRLDDLKPWPEYIEGRWSA